MTAAPPNVTADYAIVLERVILNLRMRIRFGEEISLDEIHDVLDAIHNIPQMLRDYGGWYVERNINADLARYDNRWIGGGESKMRQSLLDHLKSPEFEEDQEKAGSELGEQSWI